MTDMMIFLFMILALICMLLLVFRYRWRMNRTFHTMEHMLDAAMKGDFTDTMFDESRLSALETKFAHYFSASAISARNVQQEKDNIKKLVADISHQTKTPIANLLLYCELLQEEELPESAADNVNALYRQTERLRFLIDSLVRLSRLENGIISLSVKQQDLQPVLETVVSQYMAKAD